MSHFILDAHDQMPGSVRGSSLRPSRSSWGTIRVSFEFFPAKNTEAEPALWEAINRLVPFSPEFVSVTYGAGGSTRERTHNTVARIARETHVPPAPHLTCVGATKAEIDEIVKKFAANMSFLQANINVHVVKCVFNHCFGISHSVI